MPDRHEIKLHVDRHLLEAREMMLPRVRNAFDRLLRERGLLTPDPAPYFGPLSHPLFELPVWVAHRLNDEGAEIPEEALADVLGVSALGYFHARAQDDWLDGDSKDDPTLIAVAEALIAVCNRLLVSVVGSSPRFWQFYSQILNEYSESLLDMAESRRTDSPVSRTTFERHLAQSRPLVIPAAALLDRADRWQLRHGLEEFVLTATATSQLFNDLTDLYRDRRMGHRTWTIEAVGESGADRLWLEVAGAPNAEEGGRIRERIGQALFFHERSALAARALALTAAETWLMDRRALLEGLLGSLRANLLTTFVRRLAEPRPAGAEQERARRGREGDDQP
jgi:hypothetical protein